jgi:PAS domain S-box-containing protein
MSPPRSSEDIYGETLAVFGRTGHPNEPLTTPEVAAALDLPRRTVYKRLATLADRGDLSTKSVGSSARVWWRPAASTPETGVSGPAESEQRGLETELQATKTRYQQLVEQNLVGIYIVKDGTFEYVNPTLAETFGRTPAEMIGKSVLDVVAEDDRALVVENLEKRRRGDVDAVRYELRGKHADGTLVDVEFHGGVTDAEGEPAILGTMVDISERKRHERALEESERRYRTLAEHFPNGAVALFDHDLRYSLVEGSIFDGLGWSPAAIEGRRIGQTDTDTSDVLEANSRAALAGEKRTFEFEWQGRVFQTWMLPVEDDDGSVLAGMMMTQEVTDRKGRERELERYETIIETIDDGVYLVDAEGRFRMVNEAYTEMVGYDREELLGEHVSLVVDEEVVSSAKDIESELEAGEHEHADAPKVEAVFQRRDGTEVIAEATFALLPGDTTTTHARVGVVRDITEHREREQKIERQRQELASLNNLQRVALNLIDLVLEQSTRDEIEQAVCERLTDSDTYEFAWIGHVSRDGQEVTVDAASEARERLAGITVPLGAEESTGGEALAQAVRTHTLQRAQDAATDPVYARWCEGCDGPDHSVMVVPLAYEGRFYGVVVLYTRVMSVGEVEQEIVRQLGEVVGHAITALQREKSLLSDQVIEVEYHSRALAEPFVALANGDLEITIDRTVRFSEDGYLQYYTLRGISAGEYVELVERYPSVTNVRILASGDDYARVEVRTTDNTMTSLFTTFDGRTKTTRISDGKLRVVGELPETANIREVTEAVKEIYPDMEFAGQRHTTRQRATAEEVRSEVGDSLTERQRATLETAFYSGFFELPRESSGEDVAASIGISSSTFHQHIRQAERKILDAMFAAT